jgi:acyl carrier protein
MDFLELFNAVARVARPIHVTHNPVLDPTEKLLDTGLDSLDTLMICIYMCELYGISEEAGKHMPAETVKEIETFVMANQTQQPESVAQAVKAIQ